MDVAPARNVSQDFAADRDRKRRFLDQSTLLQGMSAETLDRLCERLKLVDFSCDESVFVEGAAADCMYLIGAGKVAVLKKMGQGERMVMHLGEGEHFGEMALISSARRNATVRALSSLQCLRMDETDFHDLVVEDPLFAQRMLKILTARFKRSDDSATRDMLKAHQALSFSLAKLADSRDPETGGHLYRVREYCALLAELLAGHPGFANIITESFIEHIYLVAPLHDIGKVAIPDGVLLKQGKLNRSEFQIMRSHTTLGAEAIDTVLDYCDFEMFHMARRIILCHHERYDGTGYPNGLEGEEIPVEARIMALADIYDALLSKRVYKEAYGYAQTRDVIAAEAGKSYDPVMTEVMLANLDQFEKIHRQFGDNDSIEW